jgi:cytochrome c oxidase subunit 2
LRLFALVLTLGIAVFVLVAGIIVIAAIRYRDRPGRADPVQDTGKRKFELAWLAGAVLLLLVIFVPTVHTMRAVDPRAGAGPPDLVVIGHQWWWEVRYPASGAVTANEIHLPAGRPMLLRLDSVDVIHDFWVPPLARKMDMTPGHPTHIWLQADAPGVYLGACVEFCGVQHAWMRIRVIADPPPRFDAWLRGQLAGPPAPKTPDAIAGARLYHEGTCATCHATGVGPDLTHLATRETLAAGLLVNTPQNLARWLADPQAVKSGSLMPNFHLSEGDVRRLVAYLETLK